LLPAGIGEKLMWGLIILLAGGYLAGTWLNRQHSKAHGAWLQAGLKALGGKPTWKWVGTMSSGAQVAIPDAAKPFRQVQITYLLLTRELLPLWGVELLRGKGDMLVIRADLRAKPEREFEVLPLQGALRRKLDRSSPMPWDWHAGPAGLGIATQGPDSQPLVDAVMAFLDRYGEHVQRLSLRQRAPHLILFARLTGLKQAPAADFLRAVQGLVSAGQARSQT